MVSWLVRFPLYLVDVPGRWAMNTLMLAFETMVVIVTRLCLAYGLTCLPSWLRWALVWLEARVMQPLEIMMGGRRDQTTLLFSVVSTTAATILIFVLFDPGGDGHRGRNDGIVRFCTGLLALIGTARGFTWSLDIAASSAAMFNIAAILVVLRSSEGLTLNKFGMENLVKTVMATCGAQEQTVRRVVRWYRGGLEMLRSGLLLPSELYSADAAAADLELELELLSMDSRRSNRRSARSARKKERRQHGIRQREPVSPLRMRTPGGQFKSAAEGSVCDEDEGDSVRHTMPWHSWAGMLQLFLLCIVASDRTVGTVSLIALSMGLMGCKALIPWLGSTIWHLPAVSEACADLVARLAQRNLVPSGLRWAFGRFREIDVACCRGLKAGLPMVLNTVLIIFSMVLIITGTSFFALQVISDTAQLSRQGADVVLNHDIWQKRDFWETANASFCWKLVGVNPQVDEADLRNRTMHYAAIGHDWLQTEGRAQVRSTVQAWAGPDVNVTAIEEWAITSMNGATKSSNSTASSAPGEGFIWPQGGGGPTSPSTSGGEKVQEESMWSSAWKWVSGKATSPKTSAKQQIVWWQKQLAKAKESQPVLQGIYSTAIAPVFSVFNVGLNVTLWTFTLVLSAVHAVITFVLSLVIFVTSLWYLLSAEDQDTSASEHGGSDELQFSYQSLVKLFFSIFLAGDEEQLRLADQLTNSVHRVFLTALKLALFHALVTWLTFKAFDVEGLLGVAVWTVVAALIAITALIPSFIVGIPGFLELYLEDTEVSTYKAIIFMSIHFYAWWVYDDLIFNELDPGGVNSYMSGLAFLGGFYTWGMEGILLGPILLLLLTSIMNTIYEMRHQASGLPGPFDSRAERSKGYLIKPRVGPPRLATSHHSHARQRSNSATRVPLRRWNSVSGTMTNLAASVEGTPTSSEHSTGGGSILAGSAASGGGSGGSGSGGGGNADQALAALEVLEPAADATIEAEEQKSQEPGMQAPRSRRGTESEGEASGLAMTTPTGSPKKERSLSFGTPTTKKKGSSAKGSGRKSSRKSSRK